MATQAILTFSDGKLEIPVEVQEKMQLKDGSKLRLVSTTYNELVISTTEPKELPEWRWEPNDRWRLAQGILSDHPEHDTTAILKAERERELAHDERKFGPYPRLEPNTDTRFMASDGMAQESPTSSDPVPVDLGDCQFRTSSPGAQKH